MITASVCRRSLSYTAGLAAAAAFYCICVKTGLFAWAGLAAAVRLHLCVDVVVVWAGLAAAARLRLCVDVVVCVGRLGCCRSPASLCRRGCLWVRQNNCLVWQLCCYYMNSMFVVHVVQLQLPVLYWAVLYKRLFRVNRYCYEPIFAHVLRVCRIF